jgi:uncharacterized protein with HEPN domain
VPSSDPVQRFADILNNTERINSFTPGLSLEQFPENDMANSAVEYALLINAEAAAKLADTVLEMCTEIP